MSVSDITGKLDAAFSSLRRKTGFAPAIALVLGSGLDLAFDGYREEASVRFSHLEGVPVPTRNTHEGRFSFGFFADIPVAIQHGRLHYYEGFDPADVVMPVRLMRLAGAEILFLTNASGAINPAFRPGDLMLVTDHIPSFVPSPLRGTNLDRLGPRFPDLSKAYDQTLNALIREAAQEEKIELAEGIYVQTAGPQFETPAEIRMLAAFGADAVGMSTVVETVAARHCGMRVCALACISNLAAGLSDKPLTEKEVYETTQTAARDFRRLVVNAIGKMGASLHRTRQSGRG